ncbi:MAG: hypothetical protein H8D45_22015 [Bacteroidetes bacterium]|nr:hypothetical protein [Bacteroidota bacterium]MBL7103290.1 hypothetical protein [Bacteroidales bacterium]
MSSCCNKYFNNAQNGCPCDHLIHPGKLSIPAGLSYIPRQIATFSEFRRAMLAGLNDKPALHFWHPKDQDDLGVMLLEMWAYICDSLSFYDETIAKECYLRSARRRPSLRKLVALLGYLPKPAVGASVFLSAFAGGRQEIELPESTAFRSGAFEEEPPQVFELDQSSIIHPFTNNWPVKPLHPGIITEENPSSLLIEPQIEFEEGTIVFIENTNKKKQNQSLLVQSIETYTGKDNKSYTKINFESQLKLTRKTQLSNIKLFTPTQSVSLWTLDKDHKSVLLDKKQLVLNALYRDINSGDHIIVALKNEYRWFLVAKTQEVLRPASSRNSIKINNVTYETAGIEIPVTKLTLDESLNYAKRKANGSNDWDNDDRVSIVVLYGMVTAGDVVDESCTTLSETDPLHLDGTVEEPINSFIPQSFILEDKNQEAIKIKGSLDYNKKEILFKGKNWDQSLYTPVEAYGNIIESSRGETVNGEGLGSGDASIANQSFKLKKKPLTYFLSSTTDNSQGVANTLSIYVDNILWQEVENFYGKTENDTVYIVRQDDDGGTHITFGDGIRGKRLTTGVNNIVANYRYGAGSVCPPGGSVTQIVKPVKGLKSIKNHIAAFGGADAEEESEIRDHGPSSVLIMNRAVSIKDMEAVVLSVPGVRNTQVEWRWHGDKQNTMVHVWYVGEAGIESSISEMLHDLSDPSTLFNVELAEGKETDLSIDVKISQNYDENNVLAEIQDKLFNTKTGILIAENISIGGPLFRSSIFKTIHEVQGVLSVKNILINESFFYKTSLSPGAGKYFDFENGNFELSSYSDYE